VALSLAEGVEDDKVVLFLELNGWNPSLIFGDLFGSFLEVSSVEPEVECELFKVEFDSDNSGGCCSESL
jgi:hypothetical protein